MPRLTLISGTLVLTIIAVVAIAALNGLIAAPAANAQDQLPTARNVETMLYTSVVHWRTIPSARTTVELRDAADQVVGMGVAMADETGEVTVFLRPMRGGRPQPGQPPTRTTPAIRPGYELRLAPEGGETVAVEVPSLGVGAATNGDRVLAKGPASAQLAIELDTRQAGQIKDVLTLDASGAAEYLMPGGATLVPDDTGVVSLSTADENVFHASFDVMSVDVTVGARQVEGVATLGTNVAISLAGADGSSKGRGTGEVLGGPEFQLPTGRDQRRFGPVAVGDTITVTQSGGLPGTDRTISGVIPHVEVDVNLGASRVEGEGPPNSRIVVVVRSPYGETAETETTTDANGKFAVDMAGVSGFGRGWTAAATFEVVPGLRVSAYKTVEQVRVGVHRSLVNGVAEPGSVITITVRGPDGMVKASDTARVGRRGNYSASFLGEGERIEVGDAVEVEFVMKDPVSVYVAEVSAMTDPERDTVRGVAPTGATVRVSQGTGNDQHVVNTDVTPGGDYLADFTGVLDLVAPMDGDVIVRLPSGHELFTGWAAVQMTVELGRSFLSGNGPVGRQVDAQLVDGDGTVVATGAAEVLQRGVGPRFPGAPDMGTSGSEWSLVFEDTLGAPVDVMPGDTVRATVGDDHFELVVPPLSGVAFVEDDLVNGQTTPGRALTLRVQHLLTGENTYVDLVADQVGNFSHQFGDDFDLQHNDAIMLSTLEQGHIVNSRFFVPGIMLDLDRAVLTGSWRPDMEIAYQLRGPSGVRASGTTMTDTDAVYRVVLEDSSGERVLPDEGDVVTVEPLSGAPEPPLELTIPELTIEWDVDTDFMGGRAVPGGHLSFFVRDAIQRGFGGPMRRRVDPPIKEDGTYVAEYTPPYNLQPGTEMQAYYRVPSGHIVVRTRYAPLLNVQHGGANVCGFSEPLGAVSATLVDSSGKELARAATTAQYDSRYSTALFDEHDELIRTEAEQTVRATLGRDHVDMTLPKLDVNVDWDTGRVQGQGPPRSTFALLRPARGCLDTSLRSLRRGRTGRDGQFQAMAAGIDPGEGFEIAFIVDDGHRFYRHVFRSLGQIYVHRDRVAGRATPLSKVEVQLQTVDGDVKGSARTVSDSNGWYDVLLMGASGEPVTSEPGDVVLLSASGENPRIVVEELRLDWSPGQAIVGIAPPNRQVRISIALEDMPPASFTLTSSDTGTFSFDEGDVPPRSRWDLDDVLGVEAVLDTPNGHQIIFELGEPVPGPGPGEPPEPPERGHTIYAPRVDKS